MHIRESLTGTILAAFVSLLLAGSQFAPLIPGWEALPEIPGSHHLDYGPSLPGAFHPLSDAFIARTLGLRRSASLGNRSLPSSPIRNAAVRRSVTVSPSPSQTVVSHALTNDDIEQAYGVRSVPFEGRTDSAGATRQSGEPSSCAPTGPTIWYRYDPLGNEGLIASTIGTRRATSLAVFAGTLGDLKEIRCHRNVQGSSRVAFAAQAATTYFFQVTTPTGGGPTVFNLDPLGTTERVSVSSQGEEVSGIMNLEALSANGRWVVFNSDAPGLVAGDDNDTYDVFVHDRASKRTTRVSVASDGTQANGLSYDLHGGISAEGRYVAFSSWASNLVDGDTNDWMDVFVHDRETGETTRVSVSSRDEQGEAPVDPACDGLGCLGGVSISADGRFVAFHSNLRGLVSGDDNEQVDLRPGNYLYNRTHHHGIDTFVHDRWTGETTMVSVHSDGTHGNDKSGLPRLSANGRYVVFGSFADNLVDYDTNRATDIFVHDRSSGETKRVSVDSRGRQGNDHAGGPPDISSSGRYVVFPSWASLVAEDTNQSLDVFVRDLETGETSRVSVTSDGDQQEGVQDPFTREIVQSLWVSISADGRFVAFQSASSDMSPGRDDAPLADWQGVFVHDRLTRTTIEPTLATQGKEGRAWSWQPILSADGRDVAFSSQDSGLVEDDDNENLYPASGEDIFVHRFPVLR